MLLLVNIRADALTIVKRLLLQTPTNLVDQETTNESIRHRIAKTEHHHRSGS